MTGVVEGVYLEPGPNEKFCLFLDLDVGRWGLSLQHLTFHFEAGPSAQLHS